MMTQFGVGVTLIVILRHLIAYFSIKIRWHTQNVSTDSRKWLITHLFPPKFMQKTNWRSCFLRSCWWHLIHWILNKYTCM
jgi:hypothetical protein